MYKKSIINFKQGDDFKLDLMVSDTNSTAALAAQVTLNAAQAAYDATVAVNPQVPADIANAQATLTAAHVAYDLAIIVDITNWIMKSQVRRSGKLMADLTVTIVDATIGKFSLSAIAAGTILWTPQAYDCDVEFTRPVSGKVSSQTFILNTERDITA